jgi:3-hydroxyacyl-CoA dehydrogenase
LEKRLDDRQLTSDEKETITSRIQFNTNLKQVVSEADLVIENGTRKQLSGYTAYNIVTLNNPGALL